MTTTIYILVLYTLNRGSVEFYQHAKYVGQRSWVHHL